MKFNPMNIIAGITAILALIAGIIAFDSRYAKDSEIDETLMSIKNDIINEMRTEVVLNRSVMISAMQREADDLEYQTMMLERENKPVPRYITEKFKQILRQIEELKDNETH